MAINSHPRRRLSLHPPNNENAFINNELTEHQHTISIVKGSVKTSWAESTNHRLPFSGKGRGQFFPLVKTEYKEEVEEAEEVGGAGDTDASSWCKQGVQRKWRKSLLPAGYERGQSGSRESGRDQTRRCLLLVQAGRAEAVEAAVEVTSSGRL